MSLLLALLILSIVVLAVFFILNNREIEKLKTTVNVLENRPYTFGSSDQFKLSDLDNRVFDLENPKDRDPSAGRPEPSKAEIEESERELVQLTLDMPVALVKRPVTGVGIEARPAKSDIFNRIRKYGAQPLPDESVNTTLGTVLNRVVNAIGVDFVKPVKADFSTRQASQVTNVYVVDSAGNVDTGDGDSVPLSGFDLGFDNSSED